jgi:hypothetical protein
MGMVELTQPHLRNLRNLPKRKTKEKNLRALRVPAVNPTGHREP